MAAAYLEELRSVQPEGPYLLGGFSGGGITAFEMAQRLRADGQEVSQLVMLDSLLPQPPDELTRLDKARVHWQRLLRTGPKYLTNWARDRIDWELQKRGRRDAASEAPDPALFRSEVIEAAFRAALPRYKMTHFNGKVVLFRPKLDKTYVLGPDRVLNVHREFVYSDNGWGKYVDELKVHEVPGDHDSVVLEPNVRVLAKLLTGYIDEAEAAARRGTPTVAATEEKTRATVDAGY
jgi:thioesterase domain-containing protein